MTFIMTNKQRKLKIFLISIIFIIFTAILTVFTAHRYVLDKEKGPVADVQSKANISIGKAHQTATRNGIMEWSMDAASVDYIMKKNQTIFHNLSVTFYLKDKSEVYLTADHAIFETDSNNMEVFGNVWVKNGIYRLKCDKLYYNHNKRIIFSKTPVKITGDTFNLVADAMSFNLNTNKTLFEGKVKGILNERITL